MKIIKRAKALIFLQSEFAGIIRRLCRDED